MILIAYGYTYNHFGSFPASEGFYDNWILCRIFLGKIITDITGSRVCVGEFRFNVWVECSGIGFENTLIRYVNFT
jgi:hypothetical protein